MAKRSTNYCGGSKKQRSPGPSKKGFTEVAYVMGQKIERVLKNRNERWGHSRRYLKHEKRKMKSWS